MLHPTLAGSGAKAECAAAAEIEKLIAEPIRLHLQGLREDGLPIPDSETECEYNDV